MPYQENLTFDPMAGKHIPVCPLTSSSPLLAHTDVTQFLAHPPLPMPLSSLLPRTNAVARKRPTREIECLCFFSEESCWGFYYHYYYFSLS